VKRIDQVTARGLVVRASAWVRFPDRINLKEFKNWFSQLPFLTFSIKKGKCEDRPASSLIVFLGKTLNGICLHL